MPAMESYNRVIVTNKADVPMIPNLEPHCGSWIVTRRATGEVIGEFYERSSVERFNPETCLIETAAQHLSRLSSAMGAKR